MDDGKATDTEHDRIVAITKDPTFEASMRDSFGTHDSIELTVHSSSIAQINDTAAFDKSKAIVIDLGSAPEQDLISLLQLMTRIDRKSSVLVIIDFNDEKIAGMLRQMGVVDALVKPVMPDVLHRACIQAMATAGTEQLKHKTNIITFVPVVGGAGVTTLAIQIAMLLNGHRLSTKTLSTAPSTCLVDLDFQHGTTADYLDLESRLNFNEIEPRPERLDRQLLEVMTSRHDSGLAVISAPHRSTEMRFPTHNAVLRLLDLVAANFENVVIDMPRSWQTWSDSVLEGSDKIFVVTRMTVPALRRAKEMVAAITERLEEKGPKPMVLVNCCERRMLRFGLRHSDINQILGDSLAGTIPADYRLANEAIDRGISLDHLRPNNGITLALHNLLSPELLPMPSLGRFLSLRDKLPFTTLTANLSAN